MTIRPGSRRIYTGVVWGHEVIRFNFFTIKVLEYAHQREWLEATENPFGVILLAQLAALETRKDVHQRFKIKFALNPAII